MSRWFDARLTLARHYVEKLNRWGIDYRAGGDASVKALKNFDDDRIQIEDSQAWATQEIYNHRVAAELCSQFVGYGYDLLALRQLPEDHTRWLEAALSASRILEDRIAENVHVLRLGIIYMNIGEYQRALDHFEWALAVADETGAVHHKTSILTNIGAIYHHLGDYAKAAHYHQQAIDARIEGQSEAEDGRILNNLGMALIDQHQDKEGLEYLFKGLELSRQTASKEAQAFCLNNVAVYYLQREHYRKAVPYLEEGLALCREIGDERTMNHLLSNLSTAYRRLNQPEKGLEYLHEALASSLKLKNRRGEANDLNNLGSYYVDAGNPDKGIEFFKQSLKIYQELELTEDIEIEERNIAIASDPRRQFLVSLKRNP